ncbi:MAG: hypothetical protein COC19_00570 [SAR86 cluster bacterium]|uniref:LysM domain-containing protein n=1 Tax=SAR86 cluster bacterium TaxID=2030880 RepID=A0A2A4MVR0_9GAMM|nr:MAG: hypothetical protein COC19_00570 [SAR86 cluster bacterium]
MYKQFDEDWLLAFAAYNTGEGNVRKAIAKNQRANKAIDFWSLPLHSETKAHIPRILAMAKLIANSALYEIEIPPISNQSYFDIVEVRAQIDLSLAAELAGIELDFLEQLNPGYLQWATHPDGPQTLLLPKQNASQFDSALAQLPVEQFITWDRYLIRSGDSLSSIAAKMGTRVDVLRSVNELRGSRIIAGESLLIPRNASSTSGLRSPLLITNSNNLAVAIPDSYRVRSGDNLWSIARKFNLKSKDIAHLNQISVDALLHPGQVLRLGSTQLLASSSLNSGSVTVDYLVKSGDSIDRIARNFSLQVEDILTWNKLSASAYIYPGQLIKLVPPSQKVR